MIFNFHGSKFRCEGVLLGILFWVMPGLGEDFVVVCTDREAVERVYYNHRIGDKPPFERALPRATLASIVRDDISKEATLKQVYGVEVTPQMLEAEVQRINSTTRAPEILAELKAALDNDPARFARSVACPILVERLLRDRFDNDDKLHAAQRRAAEQVRNTLLARKQENAGIDELLLVLKRSNSNHVIETSWQLGPRVKQQPSAQEPDEVELQRRFGPKTQILSSPQSRGKQQRLYFEDLPEVLQEVLRAQLRQPGDVSAVIEAPDGFLLYLAIERTAETLCAAILSVPKRDYEQWIAEQNGGVIIGLEKTNGMMK